MVVRAAFILFVVTQLSSLAAVDMFLQLDGVPGESTDSAHASQIEVVAWSWGMSNASTNTGSGQSTGRVKIQELAVVKYVDKASPALMLGCSKGTHYPRAILSMRKAGAQKATDHFMVITLEDVVVTGVSSGGSGGENRFTENATLAFNKVRVDYWEQRPDGGLVQVTPYTWNIATNTE